MNKTYFIAPISHGIGDLIVSLPAVQALIDAGYKTCVVARSLAQKELAQRIKGLHGVVLESEFDNTMLLSNDSYINMREHPLQTNFWWGSPSCDLHYPGFKINDFLKIICTDLNIEADFADLRPLRYSFISSLENKIVFVPGSDGPYKCWPKEYWLSLAASLEAKGMAVVMLGKPESSFAVKELVPHLTWLPTHNLTDALDVVSNALAVVAVDTGLMHLAVQQGIPTISLYRSYPIYQRDYAHSFVLTARACDARCLQESEKFANNALTNLSGFEFTSWQCQANKGQSCMANISAERVLAVMQANPEQFLLKLNNSSMGV